MNVKKRYRALSPDGRTISRLSTKSREDLKRTTMQNVGARLARRKQLFHKRKRVSDLCVFFAMLGILLMIVEIELVIFRNKDLSSGHKLVTAPPNATYIVKWTITASSLILIFCLLFYHKCDVQLFMIDNGMEDWRLAMSLSRVLLITLEVFVCILHPFPGNHDLNLDKVNQLMSIKMKGSSPLRLSDSGQPVSINVIPIDVMLSLPMFLRFYLVCRSLMLHSRLFQDASSQSLGALNRVHFNCSFIFKSLMSLYSEYVLTILITFLFLWASWAVRACEAYHSDRRIDFFNSMWLIAITFLTVGYGDLVPDSTCGKAISVLTGIFGVGCTALVVAVLARKLELSRAEMYVHNFVIGVELGKQMRHAAANVVKEGWLVHKYRRLGWLQRALKHERRLLQAIRRIREIKNDQSRVSDNSLSMLEVYRSQIYMQKSLEQTQQMVRQIHTKLGIVTETIT